MPRPQKPADNRTFREKLLPNIKHAPKPSGDKASAGDGIARRLADLEQQLETTANKKQRQRIKESIAAAKRAANDHASDMAVIEERERRATDPKYLEAVKLAESTLEAIKLNESLHQGFLDAAESNLKELRWSLDYEAFSVRQQAIKDAYDTDRKQKLASLETHRQVVGDAIQLLSDEPTPTDPAIIESRPGTKRHLFDTGN